MTARRYLCARCQQQSSLGHHPSSRVYPEMFLGYLCSRLSLTVFITLRLPRFPQLYVINLAVSDRGPFSGSLTMSPPAEYVWQWRMKSSFLVEWGFGNVLPIYIPCSLRHRRPGRIYQFVHPFIPGSFFSSFGTDTPMDHFSLIIFRCFASYRRILFLSISNATYTFSTGYCMYDDLPDRGRTFSTASIESHAQCTRYYHPVSG